MLFQLSFFQEAFQFPLKTKTDMQDQQQYFKEIMEQHKGILFKVARAYCSDDDDRQDLIQEIMIQIWQSIHKYNDQYKISTWLYRISLNVAISFYRKSSTRAKKQVELTEPMAEMLTEQTSEKEEHLEKEQHLNLLEQFICELKEIDKALMILYLEDKNHTEIAEIMGISVSNVGTKIGRIKDKLRTRFSQLKS